MIILMETGSQRAGKLIVELLLRLVMEGMRRCCSFAAILGRKIGPSGLAE